jgi:iduronate 2-sulfatase
MRFFAFVSVLLVSVVTPLTFASDSTPMNVLFISIDDLRTEVGAYGATRAITPNIDRLAAEGVKFDRAYTQYPLCNPSRISMLTGRYPRTSEMYGNRDWFNAWYPDWVSLPKYFKQHGYTTIRSGKIFHGDVIDDAAAWTVGGVPHNFSAPRPASVVADRPITAEEEAARLATMRAADIERAEGSDFWQAVEGHDEIAALGDNRSAEGAIAALKQWKRGDAPFFIGVGFVKPHSPLVAPKQFFDLYEAEKITLPPDFAPRPKVPAGFPEASIRAINADLFIERDASEQEAREMIRAYLACTSFTDWNVGRVMQALDEAGLRESTIVVLWSDHGYQLGEKGKWSKAGSLWEQGVRVPMIIHDPRAKGNGQASPRVVELLDLYPTLVDLCGLPAVAELEGRSLRALLDQPEEASSRPAFSVWSERNRGISGVVVRTERWRYAEFFGPGAGAFLSDAINDPHELTNLVNDPQHVAVVRELSAIARAHVAGKTEPTPSDATR